MVLRMQDNCFYGNIFKASCLRRSTEHDQKDSSDSAQKVNLGIVDWGRLPAK